MVSRGRAQTCWVRRGRFRASCAFADHGSSCSHFFRSGLSIRIRIKTMPISKYQLILGEGVLRRHGVCLDYSSNTVTMRDPGDSSRSLFIKGNLLAQEHVDAHVAAVFAPSPAEQASVASESPSPEAVLDDLRLHIPRIPLLSTLSAPCFRRAKRNLRSRIRLMVLPLWSA